MRRNPLPGLLIPLSFLGFSACTNVGMVLVPANSKWSTNAFYIDAYEAIIQTNINGSTTNPQAQSAAGNIPQTNVSFTDAQAACTNAGKRLCSLNEWIAACEGGSNQKFGPDSTDPNTPSDITKICNVGQTSANSTPATTGSNSKCTTPGLAVYDMVGNVSEWVVHNNSPVQAGSNLLSSPLNSDCEESIPDSVTTDSSPTLGFRCCKDAK